MRERNEHASARHIPEPQQMDAGPPAGLARAHHPRHAQGMDAGFCNADRYMGARVLAWLFRECIGQLFAGSE